MEFLQTVLAKAFELHSDVSVPVVAAVAAAAGFLVLLPQVWPRARFWITFIHEVGHGTTSILTGSGLSGIKIHRDSSGVAETWRKEGLLGWISAQMTLWAGYPFPALVALLMTLSTNVGFSSLLLFILTLASAISIFFMRNLRSLAIALSVLAISAGLFLVAPPEVHAVGMLVCAGGLLAGGFRTVLELQAHHRNGDLQDSDVAMLSRGLRPFSALVFSSYWAAYGASAASSVYFGWLLTR